VSSGSTRFPCRDPAIVSQQLRRLQHATPHVSDDDIADLRARLACTRFPDQALDTPWACGTDLEYLRGLVAYWRDSFDWRAHEARLNTFPQFTVPLHGIDLHYLHVPGQGPDPKPLLLLHGWPGSVFEFMDIVPRLTRSRTLQW
jgi:hypothetical protein